MLKTAGVVGASVGAGEVAKRWAGGRWGEGSEQQEQATLTAQLGAGVLAERGLSSKRGTAMIDAASARIVAEGAATRDAMTAFAARMGTPLEPALAGGGRIPGAFTPEIVPRPAGGVGMDAWNPPKNEPLQMSNDGQEAGGGADGNISTPRKPFTSYDVEDPLPSDPAARQQVLSEQTAEARRNSGVPLGNTASGKATSGCVGVARTDIPGLENTVFEGGSRYAGEAPDTTFIHGDGSFGQAQGHVEQNIAGEFDRAVKGLGPGADLVDKNVYINTELPTCGTCKFGTANPSLPDASLGVPVKLSKAYPDTNFIYSSNNSPEVLTIRGGVTTKSRR